MSKLPIVIIPKPVLKQEAVIVPKVDNSIRQLLDDMLDTMYDAQGVGLAANQIDNLNRVLVMDVKQTEEDEASRQPIMMVNPEVVWESEQKSVYQEGCLSIPQQYADIERPASVRVEYLDYDGNKQEMLTNADDDLLLNHCVQHEIDHLNGVLFIDYLSSLKRNMIVKKVKKWQKEHAL